MRSPTRTELLARARVGPRALIAEAFAGVAQRPARSVLTAAGAAVGVCAVVAVLGLTATASAQVNERFDLLRAREVTVTLAPDQLGVGPSEMSARIGVEGATGAGGRTPTEAVAELPGVVGAGTVGDAPAPGLTVGTLPVLGTDTSMPVRTVSTSAWSVLHAEVLLGRLYDSGHEVRADRVAVLGRGAARRLGVDRLDAAPTVFVSGVGLTVVGVVDDLVREPELLGAVLVPPSTATELWGPTATGTGTKLLVETQVGAATAIAAHLPYLLYPVAPQRLQVDAPPDPKSLSSTVSGDLDVLSLALAAISVALGALGISNTMLVTVMERIHEIGLRRALGATGAHVGGQFLVEAAVLGGMGGLVGSGIGVAAVVGTAALRDWTPVLATWVVLAAPALGLVAGLVAGVFPALRATRVQPADALRR